MRRSLVLVAVATVLSTPTGSVLGQVAVPAANCVDFTSARVGEPYQATFEEGFLAVRHLGDEPVGITGGPDGAVGLAVGAQGADIDPDRAVAALSVQVWAPGGGLIAIHDELDHFLTATVLEPNATWSSVVLDTIRFGSRYEIDYLRITGSETEGVLIGAVCILAD